MIYVDKLRVRNAVILVTLSLLFTHCSPVKEIKTNVPNYKLVQIGRSKNPTVLFFQDSYCLQNDSITTWFVKNNYQVILAERLNIDPLYILNTDHPLMRASNGLALVNSLSDYPIEYIAATGLEVHSIVEWFVNTEVKGGFLFPFYKGSLRDYLIECMYKNKKVLPGYPSTIEPIELVQLLETTPPPSGIYGNYSLRFLQNIWQQQPKINLSSYEGELLYQVVK